MIIEKTATKCLAVNSVVSPGTLRMNQGTFVVDFLGTPRNERSRSAHVQSERPVVPLLIDNCL